VLQSMGLQRVGHNFMTEQQQKSLPEEADWKGREAPGEPFLPPRQEPLGLGRDNLYSSMTLLGNLVTQEISICLAL